MASIKDIAKQLDLSVATVSYALRNDKKISEKTRMRVQQAAKEMNYIYNPIASVMQGQHSKMIGVLIHDFGGNFFGDVLRGIREELEFAGYEMVVSSSLTSFEMLLHNFFDGAIIFSDRVLEEHMLEFSRRQYPLVVMDRVFESDTISCVTLDNQMGAKIAYDQIILSNKQKLYILAGPVNNFDADERLSAIKALLLNTHLDVEWIPGDFTQKCGYDFAVQYAIENQACTILCFNDEMLLGVYQAIQNKSIISKQVSLLGFDNIDILSYLTPKLSSVGVDRFRWGKISAQTLVSQLKGMPKQNIRIEVKLNDNKSIY